MASVIEEIVDLTVARKESLRRLFRSELLSLSFTPSNASPEDVALKQARPCQQLKLANVRTYHISATFLRLNSLSLAINAQVTRN